MNTSFRASRRRLCTAAAACTLLPGLRAQPRPSTLSGEAEREEAASAHFPFGPVRPPRPLPAWPVITHLGQATTLQSLVQGRLTALQLMFTGCSATCPIQGAIFAMAQRQLAASVPGVQFLSLSIDPLGDTPQALTAWLKKFKADGGWTAAAPRVSEVDALVELLAGPRAAARTGPDPHAGQVYYIGRQGAMVHRSTDLPPPDQVVQTLRQLARTA